MKREKIGMKWKVFFYLLGFTVVLLLILWLCQICYLDTFYKSIKTREARSAMTAVTELLMKNDDSLEDEIDSLAAEQNLSVLVTDTEGKSVYHAEYMANSKMDGIPSWEFEQYYNAALSNGGSAKVEFEGNRNKTFPDMEMENEKPPEPSAQQAPEDELLKNGSGRSRGGGFFQNHGQELTESVIYVSILSAPEQELVVMINSVLTPVDATVNTLRIQLVWISAVMLVLSLLIALLISKNISKSIIKINKTAKELAGGDYRVEFNGKDYREIAELSDTLNFTAHELEKTENLRRELIANVSHDLRTPLTMIIAYSEVMRDLPGENSPENIQVIIDESSRLTNLVNDMLDLSKLQAGVLKKEASVYNLTGSIRSVLARYNKLKEQEGYSILFESDRDVFVEADEYKIYQVIYNLINNAINYTGADKTVWVRQLLEGPQVRIEVKDTGDGIRKEDIPYVWERYYKVDKSHKRAVSGTGLGLSIVKNILELHGAEYGVESETGCGSTFWFELKQELHEACES